jgi:hypothetical protein
MCLDLLRDTESFVCGCCIMFLATKRNVEFPNYLLALPISVVSKLIFRGDKEVDLSK